MKTFVPKSEDIRHDWFVIDATDVVLGRLSTTVATLLRGKHKPDVHPQVPTSVTSSSSSTPSGSSSPGTSGKTRCTVATRATLGTSRS